MQKKHSDTIREWIKTLFWAGLIAIIFRSLLLEPFNIPSGSMIPTLHVGDHLFVTKWSYGYSRNSFPFGSWNLWSGRVMAREPVVGDVIVFRKPNDSIDYVKRLIGVPGDAIQMLGGRLYINGHIVERSNPRPYVIANLPRSLRNAGFQNIDDSGRIMLIRGGRIWIDNAPATFNYTVEYRPDWICRQAPWECTPMFATEWTETLPNGRSHNIVEITDTAEYDNTTVFHVPDGHYFMMGDNRDNSRDSRSPDVGFVPRDNLLGRVWFVWYSHNYYAPMIMVWNWLDKMRWSRFGLGIN
ncbi:MAG: signal peptidase I [Alphaproteobacteria bacterium]|nr:signal peptidase I [Alphaproteobacteria bacterium]MCL2889743.1 signal peptidase I [Alphaproteobacteria bacterium]